MCDKLEALVNKYEALVEDHPNLYGGDLADWAHWNAYNEILEDLKAL